MTTTTDKTLSNLRKECKTHGITVKKETLSWGPHLTFSVNEIRSTSVMTSGQYGERKAGFEKLKEIKARYNGMELNGEKVYGL